MSELNRTDFLKAAGSGSAVLAAGAGLPLAKHLLTQSDQLTFRATAGVPEKPLPSYATHILEGNIDLKTGSGLITSRVLAGHPEDPSLIGVPGLTRVIRVTQVKIDNDEFRLQGQIEDRSELKRGESPNVEITIDRKRGVVHAPFLGRPVKHSLLSS